jgi:N-formylglutamate amidohydrolase
MKKIHPSLKAFYFSVFFLIALAISAKSQVNAKFVSADRWKAGQLLRSPNNWVEVMVGDIPIVISVPHGGFIKPENIPDRNCKVNDEGSLVTVDSKTIETARSIESAFLKKYNKRPFIIISNIARAKVDQNRPVNLGACNNSLAEMAWYDFHNSIDTSLALAVEKFGYAIFIDLHGHAHKNQRLELGYGLNGQQIKDAFENGNKTEKYGLNTSLQNYLKNDKQTFKDLLWGENSFGTLIYNNGIPAVPSMQDPYPQNDEKFFSGGYNTRRYTSNEYSGVFGWQIECNYKGVRDTEESRDSFAKAFVGAYTKFLELNFLL